MINDHVCVHLIDTPGFDDTSRSDVEVLQNIAVWLSDSFEQGTELSGIIYLHRIIDVRMAGSALRNLSMFKKLCGENAYSSVVLATSMWSLVDEALGEQREQELIETKRFWGYMHEKGSRIFRLDSTPESGLEIIKYIISLGSTTLLEVQDEIVNRGRQIEDTGAGVQLNEDIIRERKKHQAELLGLKKQMQETAEMAEHDAELQRALKEEYERLKESIRRNDLEQAKLKQDLKDVHERKDREFRELQEQMEADRKMYRDSMQNQEDAFKLQAKKYEERIRSTEELSRQQSETLERKSKEDADRVKAWTENRDTSLHLAAWNGNADMVNLLLGQGADINAKNNEGRTPLFDAAWNGKTDVVKLLCDRGADIGAKQYNLGSTALHCAAWNGNADAVEMLLDHGANIEARENNGSTPFGFAIWHGKTDVAKLLLARGANIEVKYDNGNSELHKMAFHAKADMIELLLDHGANIEAKNNNGYTPFGLATYYKKTDVAKLLLDRGARR